MRNYVAPTVLVALGAYGEQFGHVRVPKAFIVPDADGWPAEVRGSEGEQPANAEEVRDAAARRRGAAEGAGFCVEPTCPLQPQVKRSKQMMKSYETIKMKKKYKFAFKHRTEWQAAVTT